MLICISAIIFYSCSIKIAPEIPLEDFFRKPERTSYQISPDGKYYT
jgi:hypothetical protein